MQSVDYQRKHLPLSTDIAIGWASGVFPDFTRVLPLVIEPIHDMCRPDT